MCLNALISLLIILPFNLGLKNIANTNINVLPINTVATIKIIFPNVNPSITSPLKI